jgi:hypothetical protein
VKRIVRHCVKCHRHNTTTTQQLMGHLPRARITQARPFLQTGVDYAGPFFLCLKVGVTLSTSSHTFLCSSVCVPKLYTLNLSAISPLLHSSLPSFDSSQGVDSHPIFTATVGRTLKEREKKSRNLLTWSTLTLTKRN